MSYLVLIDKVKIPKRGKERLQRYSYVRLGDPARPNDLPLEIKLGDIFKVWFGSGQGGFLVNEITERNGYIIPNGCRWFRINSPEEKRWWGDNKFISEWPHLGWELLPYSNDYKLENMRDQLSGDAWDFLRGKFIHE